MCTPSRNPPRPTPGTIGAAGSTRRDIRLERRSHRPRLLAAVDDLEAVALVQLARRVLRLDAQAERLVAGRAGTVHEGREELLADPVAALGGHDGDGELRRRLVDETVAGLRRAEEPVPGGADCEAALEGDDGGVLRPAPAAHVARGQRSRDPLAPVERVAQHVAQ